MKILLTAINAKYIHSNLAVYSLRACAGEYKESVYLAEYTINNQKTHNTVKKKQSVSQSINQNEKKERKGKKNQKCH